MQTITHEQMKEKFAYMFKIHENEPFALFGFECGDGWNNLLDKLMTKIQELDLNKEIRVLQVKEKFGTLRFYTDFSTEEIERLIEEAEKESAETCEECGKPGKLRGKGWLYAACDECEKKRQDEG